jgi:hypothetical protein
MHWVPGKKETRDSGRLRSRSSRLEPRRAAMRTHGPAGQSCHRRRGLDSAVIGTRSGNSGMDMPVIVVDVMARRIEAVTPAAESQAAGHSSMIVVDAMARRIEAVTPAAESQAAGHSSSAVPQQADDSSARAGVGATWDPDAGTEPTAIAGYALVIKKPDGRTVIVKPTKAVLRSANPVGGARSHASGTTS